jgi:hypothetical protein
LEWCNVCNGGGGSSSNAQAQCLLVDSLGQVGAGLPMTGSGYVLTVGFFPGVVPTLPTLTITSPTSGQTFTNLIITASGTRADPAGVAGVFVQDTGGVWAPATTLNQWSNWSAQITLTPGANTLSAYALGSNGYPSVTNTVAFDFYLTNYLSKGKLHEKLLIQINGLGTVSPNYNGKFLVVGSTYTVTAVPDKNQIFSNWIDGVAQPYSVLTNGPVLKFVMRTNMILEANFVTNVFLAARGTYHGLFAPANAPREQTNSGAVTLSVTKAGALSGKLTLGSNAPSLAGKFNPAGAATITTPRKGQSSLITTLQLNFGDQTLTGFVTDTLGSFMAPVTASLNFFSAKQEAVNYEGAYTFIIAGTTNMEAGPLGTSFGTVKVSPLGAITYDVFLADGTTVLSQSSVVSKEGYWPFYVPLYGGKGSIWGWNYFSNSTPQKEIVSATNSSWINGGNSARTALYRNGFTNQEIVLFGSPYEEAGYPLLKDLSGDMVLLYGGDFETPLTNAIALSGKVNGGNLVLSVTKSNGVIKGSFINPSSLKTITVNGVLLQNQTNIAGYFLGGLQSGAFTLAP